jgi:hypothetical protein
MSQGLHTIQPHDLAAELEAELFPGLVELLRSRGRGHCMRLTDLDHDLMVRLCGRLRAEVPESQVVILGNGHSTTPPTLTVTSFQVTSGLRLRTASALRRLKKCRWEMSMDGFVLAFSGSCLLRFVEQLLMDCVVWSVRRHGPSQTRWPWCASS